MTQQHRPDIGARAFGIGPSDDDKLLAIEALGLEPQAAIARHIRRVSPLRHDAFQAALANLCMKRPAATDLMIRVEQWRIDPTSQVSQPVLTIGEGAFDEIPTVQVQEIESPDPSVPPFGAARHRMPAAGARA
jgi:hypothetical protein